jgi:hypothetical protein
MMTYSTLSTQAGPFLAMTGLTLAEFRELLPGFAGIEFPWRSWNGRVYVRPIANRMAPGYNLP